MKAVLFLLSFLHIANCCLAQVNDTTRLSEVTVSGIRVEKINTTSLNLRAYALKKLEIKSPYNLSDALAKLPGISQMTTGNSISKPVIRGLYGNRVLVLLSGTRFDNQQWQDEHGLGLSQIGIEGVEIIKGPASLLYGTDAVGGVINVIEETPQKGERVLNINTRLYSGTLGTLTDIGYKTYRRKTWWRVRGGIENHADYSDGSNIRILNSRNKGYYLKAGMGFNKAKWVQNNSYNFSYNQYGFIIADLHRFFDVDERWTRSMAGPHHNVFLNTFTSQNTFSLRNSVLKVNAGIQSNRRMEDEGGGSISLDMHLVSLLQNAKWEKYLSQKTLLVLNQQFTFENNNNLGKRILIPDANMLEGNFSAFLHITTGKINLETGAGINYKQIKTLLTGRLNIPGEFVQPFRAANPSGNAMAGVSYNPTNNLNFKFNLATGTRMANLAELSSNGIHEGSYRYEVGDKALHAEQNLNADLGVNYKNEQWELNLSGFYNRFLNYIYLSPTADSFVGFQIFRYKQNDATLHGGELYLAYNPIKVLQLKETFSATNGLLDGGTYLPFIPAYKSLLAIRLQQKHIGKLQSVFAEPELEYVFPQNKPSIFETATASYSLINIHMGFTTPISKHVYNWNLSCRNLLNTAYMDHLSRLKYYGLYNQGINFILSMNTDIHI